MSRNPWDPVRYNNVHTPRMPWSAKLAGIVSGTEPAGVPGPPGQDGEDGSQGPPGVEGAAGAAGATGAAGANGAAGATGAQGIAGAPGEDGADGAAGPPGVDGAAGVAGSAGATGAVGPPGPQGEEGPEGPQGPPGVGLSGSGTDNHVMRWNGTGAAQDSDWVLSDAPGIAALPDGAGLSWSGGTYYITQTAGIMTVVASEVEIAATNLNLSAVVNFQQNLTTGFRIENRTSDPGAPAAGQIWLRTDL